MKPSAFSLYLASIIVGMTAGAGALFLLFDRLVMPDRDHVWRSYHEIILDYVPGPRILIDSGSNTAHAIAPELIEREFERPTIIIADNATIPLGLRLGRLEKYSKAGDVIILPLEWGYYKEETTPSDFLDEITGEWSEYYFAMPRIEQFRFFVGHIKLDQILSALWRRIDATPRLDQRKSREHVMDEKFNWSGVTKASLEIRKRHVSMQGKSCSQYIFVPTGEPPDFVRRTAIRLSQLQKQRQVVIVVTWPAVAGTDCYNFVELDSYVEKLRRIFNDAGIAVIADPRSSLFSEDHTLDTYYHIDIDAAYTRTRRLVEDIKRAGLLRAELNPASPSIENGSDALIATAIMKEEARIAQNNSMLILPLATGAYTPGTEEFENFFQLSPSGWHDFESWGAWSRGDKSEIALRPQLTKTCNVKLDARYFAEARPSSIFLDGKLVKIDDGNSVSIAPGDEPITIGLQHRDVRSPRDLGISDDPRRLAFGLSRIIVSCD
ncbi:MAG: hypothetical protein WB816_00845 [Methylocystis sp.]